MSSIKKRILEFISTMEISKYKFYQETGITRGVLDSDSGITEDNIIKFVNRYPEIDLNWLIRGEGTEPLPTSKKEVKSLKRETNEDLKDEIIRLLTVDEDIQKAFKYIIGKEINTFTSQKLLTLVNDKSFFEAMSSYLNESKGK
ncbi:hypothetical protein AWE51_10065 [Aquimarina aggregata]|uniref:Uncharacterized protein n=1 Tax=Aquimarina aggregata TaxID=1642818 RepID=A0A162F9Q1_9FLAO|nr:hypothetical protein [Aquimarina aggregata]KZS39976.1 hypothetical protein AWE51_10065 [Aquimarina aggregata]